MTKPITTTSHAQSVAAFNAASSNPGKLARMLAHGLDPNLASKRIFTGRVLLDAAIASNQPESARLLMQHGAKIKVDSWLASLVHGPAWRAWRDAHVDALPNILELERPARVLPHVRHEATIDEIFERWPAWRVDQGPFRHALVDLAIPHHIERWAGWIHTRPEWVRSLGVDWPLLMCKRLYSRSWRQNMEAWWTAWQAATGERIMPRAWHDRVPWVALSLDHAAPALTQAWLAAGAPVQAHARAHDGFFDERLKAPPVEIMLRTWRPSQLQQAPFRDIWEQLVPDSVWDKPPQTSLLIGKRAQRDQMWATLRDWMQASDPQWFAWYEDQVLRRTVNPASQATGPRSRRI